MGHPLEGTTVAILATDGVERIELEEPRGALLGAGARTVVLALHDGEIEARQMDTISAGTIPVDGLVSDASVGDYDALLLPGGTVLRHAGADILDEEVVVEGSWTRSRSPHDLPAFCA